MEINFHFFPVTQPDFKTMSFQHFSYQQQLLYSVAVFYVHNNKSGCDNFKALTFNLVMTSTYAKAGEQMKSDSN